MAFSDYNKSIVGGLTAFLGALEVAQASGGITVNEWIWIAVTTLAGAGFVAAVPNSGTYAWIEQQFRNNAALIAQVKTQRDGDGKKS
jgi:hypothetical protein